MVYLNAHYTCALGIYGSDKKFLKIKSPYPPPPRQVSNFSAVENVSLLCIYKNEDGSERCDQVREEDTGRIVIYPNLNCLGQVTFFLKPLMPKRCLLLCHQRIGSF